MIHILLDVQMSIVLAHANIDDRICPCTLGRSEAFQDVRWMMAQSGPCLPAWVVIQKYFMDNHQSSISWIIKLNEALPLQSTTLERCDRRGNGIPCCQVLRSAQMLTFTYIIADSLPLGSWLSKGSRDGRLHKADSTPRNINQICEIGKECDKNALKNMINTWLTPLQTSRGIYWYNISTLQCPKWCFSFLIRLLHLGLWPLVSNELNSIQNGMLFFQLMWQVCVYGSG